MLLDGINNGNIKEIALNNDDTVKIPEIFCKALGDGHKKGHKIYETIVCLLEIKNDDLWDAIYNIPCDKLPKKTC
jgi:hypothetical protein